MLRSVGFLLAFTSVAFALTLGVGAQFHLAERGSRVAETGCLLTRLSEKDRARFQAVEELVFAEDGSFQPLYPTLRGLWEWVETSGHRVFIEMVVPHRLVNCTAGSFVIEAFDAEHHRHIAVLKLNLATIDQAQAIPQTTRIAGFVPFAGLDRVECYAEVLGHELAHAAYILTNPERTRAVEEMVEQTNELFLQVNWLSKKVGLSEQLIQRLARRDLLLRELESQAETMEAAIWRELKAGQAQRNKLRDSAHSFAAQAGRK